MKTKGFGKKLVFKKQTITNLDDKQLSGIQGGIAPPTLFTRCPDCTLDCTQISDCLCPTDEQWNTCCGSAFACSC
jgi:hypothetical protein